MKKINNLKEYREKAGLTQEELGKSVGLSQETISQYEKGARHPSVYVAKKIAKILDGVMEKIF